MAAGGSQDMPSSMDESGVYSSSFQYGDHGDISTDEDDFLRQGKGETADDEWSIAGNLDEVPSVLSDSMLALIDKRMEEKMQQLRQELERENAEKTRETQDSMICKLDERMNLQIRNLREEFEREHAVQKREVKDTLMKEVERKLEHFRQEHVDGTEINQQTKFEECQAELKREVNERFNEVHKRLDEHYKRFERALQCLQWQLNEQAAKVSGITDNQRAGVLKNNQKDKCTKESLRQHRAVINRHSDEIAESKNQHDADRAEHRSLSEEVQQNCNGLGTANRQIDETRDQVEKVSDEFYAHQTTSQHNFKELEEQDLLTPRVAEPPLEIEEDNAVAEEMEFDVGT